MGKGKGKKGRAEAKLDAKKAFQEPKIPGLLKSDKPLQKAKKVPSREKKSALNTNPPGPANYPLPMGRPKPFTKSPQHAKWPALFKKHLGVIEAHIRSLDRVMQSMKSEMGQMEEKERLEWELGERGNWRVICEMMDRAREVLAAARKAAQGILPSRALKDKKGLGVAGTNFEPLGPKLDQRAKELGYKAEGKGKLGRDANEVDSDGDTIMSNSSSHSDSSDSDSSSDSSSEEEGDNVTGGADSVSLSGANAPQTNGHVAAEESSSDDSSSDDSDAATNGVEPNPYFVVDTEPTPVTISDTAGKKKETKREKKERLAAERAVKKTARKAVGAEIKAARLAAAAAEAVGESVPEVDIDFKELEKKLGEEIAAGKKAQEEEQAARSSSEEKKKKRRRISDGTTEVEAKKAKKVKKEECSKEKRKLEEFSSDEVVEKKPKKEKKEKKRKAEDEEAEEGHTKKRKQEA